MYSGTCINRSCCKVETLLRRTDTFGLVCFLYASLSRISKAETVKRTLIQTDNFFQSSDKKPTLHGHKKCKNSGKQRIKLDIFVNFLTIFNLSSIFTHWGNNNSFWFHFAVLKEYGTFESNSVSYFPICPLQPNQQLFCITESDIGQGPFNHTPPLYELLVSVLRLTLSFGEVSKTCRRMH